MRKAKNHRQHERIAVIALMFTILLAGLAYYYVWKQQVSYGLSVEGLRAYACAQYMRENPKAEDCPSFIAVQLTETDCCCETRGGFGLDTRAKVSVDATEAEQTMACQERCSEHGAKRFVSLGRCGFKLPMPG